MFKEGDIFKILMYSMSDWVIKDMKPEQRDKIFFKSG